MNTIIEKIRAEVLRHKELFKEAADVGGYYASARRDEANEILSFLDTLQEQPVCEELELEREAVSYCYDNGLNLSPRVAKDFARHFIALGQQSNPKVSEGLEEEIERYLSTEWELDEDLNKDEPIYIYDCTWEDLKILARHFAQWQKEQLMKEADKPCHTVEEWMEKIKNADALTKAIFSKGPYDVLYDALNHPYRYCYDAVKEFGELCYQTARQEMMKEAVEGEVVKDINNKLAVTAKNVNLDKFKFGERVRIIICKKED